MTDYEEMWLGLSREFELLEAENARLLKALKPFAEMKANFDEESGLMYAYVMISIDVVKAARAAMGESDG